MTILKSVFVLGLLGIALSGCAGSRTTIYVSNGDPVRLRETVKDAAVWVADDKGVWVPGMMDLPPGWYVLPDPGELAP